MNVGTQFPSLIGNAALPAMTKDTPPKGKLTHPLASRSGGGQYHGQAHPLAKGGSKAPWKNAPYDHGDDSGGC